MKIIVVYKSKYGTAEQYAKWIAEELNCDIKEMGEIRARDLDAYDGIIFGGGVHAGGIEGFDTFRKWLKPVLSDAYFASFDDGVNFRQDWYKPSKKIIIFAVGINVQNFDARAELRNVNFDKKWLRPVTCYFLDGKYEPERVQSASGQNKQWLRPRGPQPDRTDTQGIQRVRMTLYWSSFKESSSAPFM